MSKFALLSVSVAVPLGMEESSAGNADIRITLRDSGNIHWLSMAAKDASSICLPQD